ncbi:MAG: LysR family transcriptional regulator [Chloroflexi bacterium]|nr:LysR family transcriptional regulator [Chloroflexota bacterium]
MDVSTLENFLLVAERGSFTAAARELGISQPGLTRQIQKLERSLGVALLARAREGVSCTPAGERYRAFASDVIARHHQMLDELLGAEASLGGELRIIASTTPGEFLVPRLVAEFTEAYPEVRPVVFTTASSRVVEELLEGRWHMGFVGAPMQRPGLHLYPVGEDEVVLAVAGSHPFARGPEVPLAALATQRFVEREDGSGTILNVKWALWQRGLALPPYRVAMTLSTTQAIVSAVRAGYGVGFVSSMAIDPAQKNEVVAVRIAGVPIRRTLYLVREERRLLPPVARRFVDFVLRQAKNGA